MRSYELGGPSGRASRWGSDGVNEWHVDFTKVIWSGPFFRDSLLKFEICGEMIDRDVKVTMLSNFLAVCIDK
jgi:hypothetical protein